VSRQFPVLKSGGRLLGRCVGAGLAVARDFHEV